MELEKGISGKEGGDAGRTGCFNRLERFSVGLVRMILGGILVFLAVLSASVTCRVYGGAEVVQYGRDWPVVHLLTLAAVLLFVVSDGDGQEGKKRKKSCRLQQERRFMRVLMVAVLFYLIWIVLMLVWGGADSRLSMASARALLQGERTPWFSIPFQYGNSSQPIGYAYTYPSQNGLILYMIPAAFLFGEAAPYVLQAVNVGFFILGVLSLWRLMEPMQKKTEHGIPSSCRNRVSAYAMLLFLPFGFYILFVYGTMPGFGLSCLAMERAARYAERGRGRDFWICAISAVAAALLKSNYLIVLVAVFCYLAAKGLFSGRFRVTAAAFLLAGVYALGSRGLAAGVTALTGQSGGGIPMTAWVEMGLQDSSRAPGWYNGYHISTFLECDGDTERMKEQVKEDLQETLQAMMQEPGETASFFLKKLESIWAEPTFQSLWIQEVGGGSWAFPGFSSSLLEEDGMLNRAYVVVANLIQTLVYAGAFLWLLFDSGSRRWENLMPGIAFIGGFLFHLVWEAKGQYTVCYFILLLPYACQGIRQAAGKIRELGAARKKMGIFRRE